MKRNRKTYSKEFKQDAVNFYFSSGKSVQAASKDLNISQSSLHNWVKSAKSNEGLVAHRGSGNYSSDTEKEIAKLKKQLRDKEDALNILKKAIGILNEN